MKNNYRLPTVNELRLIMIKNIGDFYKDYCTYWTKEQSKKNNNFVFVNYIFTKLPENELIVKTEKKDSTNIAKIVLVKKNNPEEYIKIDLFKTWKQALKIASDYTEGEEEKKDGLKNNFYDIKNCKDVDDLTAYWDLSFFEGNILKSLVGAAKAKKGKTRHSGTNRARDINKIIHYANKIKEQENE